LLKDEKQTKSKKINIVEAITHTNKNSKQLYPNSMSQNVVAKGWIGMSSTSLACYKGGLYVWGNSTNLDIKIYGFFS